MPKGYQNGANIDAKQKPMKKQITKQFTQPMTNDDKTMPKWNQTI